MHHNLEIPHEIYTALEAAARASGMSPVGWIAAHLPPSQPAEPQEKEDSSSKPKTMADLFEGRIGRIRSGGEPDLSVDCGEKFTDYLEAKKKAGNL